MARAKPLNGVPGTGPSYLDGAIMATPDFIGTDAGTILISGQRQAFDANEDMFRALGGNVQHVGEEPGTCERA